MSVIKRGRLAYKRNAQIDFYKFLMSLIVLLHHSRYISEPAWTDAPFPGGYLPVEFFFIVSGYLATKRVYDNPNATYKDAFRWTAKKFARFFQYAVPIGIVHRIMCSIIDGIPMREALEQLVYNSYEFFLLRMAGFSDNLSERYGLGHYWYLSALIIVLPIFFSALIKSKTFVLYVIAPLSAVLFYGWLASREISLATAGVWMGLFKQGTLRAWTELCLGGISYLFASAISKITFHRLGEICLSILDMGAMICALLYMMFKGWSQLDYFCVGLFLVSVSIAASEKSSISHFFSPHFSELQQFTLVLYLCQWTVGKLIMPLIQPRGGVLMYVVLSILYSLLWIGIVSGLHHFHIKNCLVRLFIS